MFESLAPEAVVHYAEQPAAPYSMRGHREAVFTLTNTGMALPAELRSRVFERFFRGDLAHNSATEGSGLGLSIAKSIVEAHQGVISYSVLPEDRTQVVVTLPSQR